MSVHMIGTTKHMYTVAYASCPSVWSPGSGLLGRPDHETIDDMGFCQQQEFPKG